MTLENLTLSRSPEEYREWKERKPGSSQLLHSSQPRAWSSCLWQGMCKSLNETPDKPFVFFARPGIFILEGFFPL